MPDVPERKPPKHFLRRALGAIGVEHVAPPVVAATVVAAGGVAANHAIREMGPDVQPIIVQQQPQEVTMPEGVTLDSAPATPSVVPTTPVEGASVPVAAPAPTLETTTNSTPTVQLIGVDARPRMFQSLPKAVVHLNMSEAPAREALTPEQTVATGQFDSLATELFTENPAAFLDLDGHYDPERMKEAKMQHLKDPANLAKILSQNPTLAEELKAARIKLPEIQ